MFVQDMERYIAAQTALEEIAIQLKTGSTHIECRKIIETFRPDLLVEGR